MYLSMRVRRGLLVLASILVGANASAAPENDAFLSFVGREVERVRNLSAYVNPGCDISALVVDDSIARSHDALLHPGDRIVAVGDRHVNAPSDAFALINRLQDTKSVDLTIGRESEEIVVRVKCLNSADSISVYLAALNGAASGDFRECAERAQEYGQKFGAFSRVYSVWRRCALRARQLKPESVWTTYATYWTLRLQELKFKPMAVERTRTPYLHALVQFSNAGQYVLADELRRQWAIATGEPFVSGVVLPGSQSAFVSRPSSAPTAPSVPFAPAGSSCENGHWIQQVIGNGAFVNLEDGTLRKIDSLDTIDSSLWLPTSDIVVCDGQLINTDDDESVGATRIR